MQRRVNGVLVVVLALGMASCGGSASGGRSSNDTSSGSSFQAKTELVCRTVQQGVLEKPELLFRGARGGSGATAAHFRANAVAVVEKHVADVKALKPPSDLARTFAQYTDVLARKSELFAQRIQVANQKSQTLAQREAVLSKQSARLARELKLRDCR